MKKAFVLFSIAVTLAAIVAAVAGALWIIATIRHKENAAAIGRAFKTAAIVAAVCFIGTGITYALGGAPEPKQQDATPPATVEPAQEPAQEPVSTPQDEEEPDAQTTDTEPPQGEEDVNVDMEIITRDGHPTYYGSVEKSHSTWSNVERGKIKFADGFAHYNDKPILSMSSYRQSDLIRGILVSFQNFSTQPNMKIDDVLPIVATYMPFEIMETYYQYAGSEMIAPDEGAEENGKYYIISYSLTDDAKSTFRNNEHEYSGSIDVQIHVDEHEFVESFSIGFGLPKWMFHLEQNKYHRDEWNCDLFDLA